MSNSAYEHQIQDLRKPSRCAVITLATAALEKVLAAAKPHPEVDSLLRSLLDDLWRWQSEEKVRGKADMSREDARALPSTRFYDTYEARLLALADEYSDRGKVYHLIGATIALLGFTVWLMDGLERQMNPGKPFVLRNDILEVDWETLVAGLATAIEAADDPDEAFAWQKAAVARLAAEHPRTSEVGGACQPVPRDYFTGDIAIPERAPRSEPPGDEHDSRRSKLGYEPEELKARFAEPDELEGVLTDYAAVACATAATEQAMPAAKGVPEVDSELGSLVADLWKWQLEEKAHGKELMPAEEAKSLPSFAFYARFQRMRDLASRYQEPPSVHALLAAAVDALDFIIWIMDGVERRMNPGKPFVVSDEVGGREWEALIDALEWAAKASSEPDQTREWQMRTLSRLSKEHPGDPDGGVLGEPLTRNYFF